MHSRREEPAAIPERAAHGFRLRTLRDACDVDIAEYRGGIANSAGSTTPPAIIKAVEWRATAADPAIVDPWLTS